MHKFLTSEGGIVSNMEFLMCLINSTKSTSITDISSGEEIAWDAIQPFKRPHVSQSLSLKIYFQPLEVSDSEYYRKEKKGRGKIPSRN